MFLHHVPRIKAYVTCFLSKKAYNTAAIEGQQRMKKGATWAAKRACTKASATIVTAELNRELSNARPQSPPPDPAASAAWHHDNGLVVPDHLLTEPGLTVQKAGPSTEAASAKLAGTPHPDPQPSPAPYTDIPMEDAKNPDDWVPRDPWSCL
jgi:hypothetical protein